MKLKSLLIKWNNYCCFNRKKTITTIKPVKTKRQHLFVYQQDTASYFTSKELGLKPQRDMLIQFRDEQGGLDFSPISPTF